MRTNLLLVLLVTMMLPVGASCGRSGPATAPTLEATTVPRVTSAPMSPVISEIKVDDSEPQTVVFKWKTDVPTIGRLEYGLINEHDLSTPWTEVPSTSHVAMASDLAIYNHYNFRIRVRDTAGNEALSEDRIVYVYHHLLQGEPGG